MKRLFSEYRAVFFSALISLAILLALMLALGIAPFGDRSLLTIDAYHQYAPFHAELRERLSSGSSLMYSWNGGLGKDFYGQMTYYLFSPFALLTLLFPAERIVSAMHLIIILKTMLMAACAAYALLRLDKHEERQTGVLQIAALSLLYTFSGFYAAFYWNVMWLDGAALFPLVLLGLYELATARGKWRFLFSMAACLITNYFIGVIILLCSLVIFALLLVMDNSQQGRREVLAKLLRFALCCLLAVGMAMFVLLPSLRSLAATDATGVAVENPLHFYTRFCDFISQHLMGAESQTVVYGDAFANAYSGVLTLLLVPLYFSLKSVSRKHKLVAAAALLLLYLCMNNVFFDYVVHAFHINKGLPHRYSFIHTAILLLLARRVILNRESLSKKWLLASALAIALLCLYSVVISPVDDQPAKMSNAVLLVNIALLLGYAALMLLGKRRKALAGVLALVLLVVCSGEIFFHQYTAIRQNGTTSARAYDSSFALKKDMQQLPENEFYRVEVMPAACLNDAALIGYPGMMIFSSVFNQNTAMLLQSLGYPGTAVAYDNGVNTPFMDSLLGIKYFYLGSEPWSGYTMLQKSGTKTVYENSMALSPGFVVNSAADSFNLDEDIGAFERQNKLSALMTGVEEPLLASAAVTAFYGKNLTLAQVGAGQFSYELTQPKSFALPQASFELTVVEGGPVWLAIETKNSDLLEIVLPTYSTFVRSGSTNSLLYLGELNAQDKIIVHIQLSYRDQNQKYFHDSGKLGIYAATFDENVFDAVHAALEQRSMHVVDFGDTHLSGTVDAGAGGLLLFSIPFANGWSATLDGEPAELRAAVSGSLLALDVGAGTHEISLSYKTPALKESAAISIAALTLTVVWISLPHLSIKKQNNSRKNKKTGKEDA